MPSFDAPDTIKAEEAKKVPARTNRGRAAEGAVARYLERRGCQLIARNFRGKHGEIDLIIRDGSSLAFVEVKARKAGTEASLYAVDRRKQRRILAVALEYVARHRLHGVPLRFDTAAVSLDSDGHPCRLRYIRGAFDAETWGRGGPSL